MGDVACGAQQDRPPRARLHCAFWRAGPLAAAGQREREGQRTGLSCRLRRVWLDLVTGCRIEPARAQKHVDPGGCKVPDVSMLCRLPHGPVHGPVHGYVQGRPFDSRQCMTQRGDQVLPGSLRVGGAGQLGARLSGRRRERAMGQIVCDRSGEGGHAAPARRHPGVLQLQQTRAPGCFVGSRWRRGGLEIRGIGGIGIEDRLEHDTTLHGKGLEERHALTLYALCSTFDPPWRQGIFLMPFPKKDSGCGGCPTGSAQTPLPTGATALPPAAQSLSMKFGKK